MGVASFNLGCASTFNGRFPLIIIVTLHLARRNQVAQHPHPRPSPSRLDQGQLGFGNLLQENRPQSKKWYIMRIRRIQSKKYFLVQHVLTIGINTVENVTPSLRLRDPGALLKSTVHSWGYNAFLLVLISSFH